MPSTTYQLRVIENHACVTFAAHVAHCAECLGETSHTPIRKGICDEGRRLKDNHIEAARDLAERDPDFARRYPNLIA